MGFGDAARAALAEAVKALQAIAEVKAIVAQIQVSSAQHEHRVESRLAEIETRLRELEREHAKLGGRVEGAYSEALKAVFFDKSERLRPGSSTADIKRIDSVPGLDNSPEEPKA